MVDMHAVPMTSNESLDVLDVIGLIIGLPCWILTVNLVASRDEHDQDDPETQPHLAWASGAQRIASRRKRGRRTE